MAIIMNDLPDELMLLLLEKICDGNSLLRCRKACRLLHRISFDRILLSKFNIICNNDQWLLAEEVMRDKMLFAIVIKDGRWKRMIDVLVKRRFQMLKTLMPDNKFQSLFTVCIIDNTDPRARWATQEDTWKILQYAAGTIYDNQRLSIWNTMWSGAWSAARSIVLGVARDIMFRSSVRDITRNISSEMTAISQGHSLSRQNRREQEIHIAEYLLLLELKYDINNWNKIYQCFDGLTFPEIQPFWDDQSLQGNVRLAEYKWLFSCQ
jgi:hypothetical protein